MGCTMSINYKRQFYLGVEMVSRKMILGCLLPEPPCYGPGRPRIHLSLTVQCLWGSIPFYDSNFLVPSPTNSYIRPSVIFCFLCDIFLSFKNFYEVYKLRKTNCKCTVQCIFPNWTHPITRSRTRAWSTPPSHSNPRLTLSEWTSDCVVVLWLLSHLI